MKIRFIEPGNRPYKPTILNYFVYDRYIRTPSVGLNVFIGIFTYAAVRGYKIASYLRKHTNATVVLGGLHASMNYKEAVRYADYVMLGEGDETILPLIKMIKSGKRPKDDRTYNNLATGTRIKRLSS